ncbi:MAG: type II toxin-antitoxin system HipA family toxin [Jatrophihabitantaceae bacterium]
MSLPDGDDVLAGTVYSHRARGRESTSFVYDAGYLADRRAYALDPQLPLSAGPHQSAVDLPMFRAFADSTPDRWGRNLIRRAERMRARDQHDTVRSFGEFDLLLGVRDDLRQGALRFRDPDTGEFVATHTGVPLLTDLPTLLSAADRVAGDAEDAEALLLLLRAGSSLGGARPKAHVRAANGRLAIAKFPSPADDWNVMAWEKTAHDLAAAAGIDTPTMSLLMIDGRSVLVIDRFDRDPAGRRIGYASALTMLEARDGDTGDYLDIGAVIEQRSPAAGTELRQLWRRMVFGVLISNTDDHLRNHGFLHDNADAWRLSPAFDLNPDPEPGEQHLATAIDGDTIVRLDAVMQVAAHFRVNDPLRVLGEVARAVSTWRQVAAANGLTRRDVDEMEPAFAQLDRARAIAG